jgi:hypothetical protein
MAKVKTKRSRKPTRVKATKPKRKRVATPKPKPPHRLSTSPEARRARARRRELARLLAAQAKLDEQRRLHRNALARARYHEARQIAEALEAQRLERLAQAAQKRALTAAAKRAGIKRPPPDERALAIGWLEHIRADIAHVFLCSLDITEAGGGAAELEGKDAQIASRTPWLVVGRFDPQEDIDYQTLAQALRVVADDVLLEAQIHPQRLSQIRVVFHDPRSNRDEGDSVVSKIGAWEFILGDLIGELVGGSLESPDESSLAGRYDETTVPQFYIFFSTTVTRYVSAAPWAKTQTVRIQ